MFRAAKATSPPVSCPDGIDGNPGVAMLRKLRNNRGATAIEYGLIAALISVAAITAMSKIGTKLGNTFNNVAGKLSA